jgi:CubicO group peptidase (beta-lactamase class C family)
MRNPNALLRLLLASAVAALTATPTQADHFPRDSLLTALSTPGRTYYKMVPSSAARELPVDQQNEAVAAMARPLVSSNVFSLLLVERGRIQFESYATDLNEKTPFVSASVGKSMTALALGEALCAGKIASLDDRADRYSKHLEGTAHGTSTIRNLLKMASGADMSGMDLNSGVNWNDYLSLVLGKMTLVDYVRKNSRRKAVFFKEVTDGEIFQYSGRDTAAISLVVEGATGMRFQEWFEKTVWHKAGAADPGHWGTSNDERAISEGRLFATARDYARIGQYVLESLGPSGDPCLRAYLTEATTGHMAGGGLTYGYQFWIDLRGLPQMRGHSGQQILLDVRTQRILVTTGSRGNFDGMTNLFHRWLDRD